MGGKMETCSRGTVIVGRSALEQLQFSAKLKRSFDHLLDIGDKLLSEITGRWVVLATIDRPLCGLKQEASNKVSLYVVV